LNLTSGILQVEFDKWNLTSLIWKV